MWFRKNRLQIQTYIHVYDLNTANAVKQIKASCGWFHFMAKTRGHFLNNGNGLYVVLGA